MQPTRLRLDLLLVLARTDQHDVAELVGIVRYRYDPALEPSRHGLEPGAVLIPQFTNPAGRYSEVRRKFADGCLLVLLSKVESARG